MTAPAPLAQTGIAIPRSWSRCGLVLPRMRAGVASEVVGDPCIAWDEDECAWRMVLFASPPGHAHALCRDPLGLGPWEFLGPIPFADPQALLGGSTHKPYLVLDAHRPNRAARIDGRFCLLGVSWRNGRKLVQRAWSEKLAGPWRVDRDFLLDAGGGEAFDGKHVDAVSAVHVPERGSILYSYMGYPLTAQAWPLSPYGSAQAMAVEELGGAVRKLGPVLPPEPTSGHWASGYLGGMQILPGRDHRWIAMVNASPTAPRLGDAGIAREEPPPSLGGFAVCDQEWPTSGWRLAPRPIERIEDLPASARATGEGVNLWRHHVLLRPDGRLLLFYNSGTYGREQMYAKISDPPSA